MNLLKKILGNKLLLTALFIIATLILSNTPVLAANGDCVYNEALKTDIIEGSNPPQSCISVNQGPGGLGFRIPTLSNILTFAIRLFFIIGGLAALVFLLLGALAWITSGGDKENVSKAQQKITNAIIGVILIAVVLAVIVTLEQVIFGRAICLGLSCPLTIPSLIKP